MVAILVLEAMGRRRRRRERGDEGGGGRSMRCTVYIPVVLRSSWRKLKHNNPLVCRTVGDYWN